MSSSAVVSFLTCVSVASCDGPSCYGNVPGLVQSALTYDVIIFARDTDQTQYTGQWNAITRPIIVLNSLLAQTWSLLPSTATSSTSSATLVVTASGANAFPGLSPAPTLPAGDAVLTSVQADVSNAANFAGNSAVILGTPHGSSNVWIARWPGGVSPYSGSPIGTSLAADRFFFAAGARTVPIGAYNLAARGQNYFLAFLNYVTNGCTSGPCHNGGTCIKGASPNTWSCNCAGTGCARLLFGLRATDSPFLLCSSCRLGHELHDPEQQLRSEALSAWRHLVLFARASVMI